jgi:hypothetical protein
MTVVDASQALIIVQHTAFGNLVTELAQNGKRRNPACPTLTALVQGAAQLLKIRWEDIGAQPNIEGMSAGPIIGFRKASRRPGSTTGSSRFKVDGCPKGGS